MCEAELRRITHGPQADEGIPGIGTVRFVVSCNGNAEEVLRNAKAVMGIVARECAAGWRDDADWREMLPSGFVEACAEEMTDQEAESELKRCSGPPIFSRRFLARQRREKCPTTARFGFLRRRRPQTCGNAPTERQRAASCRAPLPTSDSRTRCSARYAARSSETIGRCLRPW